jgi:hypothetical protein
MKQQKGEGPPEGGEVAGDKYISPVFSFDEEEHRELMSAANNVDLVLKGERGHDVRIAVPASPSVGCCWVQHCVRGNCASPALHAACYWHAHSHMQSVSSHCSPAAAFQGTPWARSVVVDCLVQALMPALPEELEEDEVDEGAGGGKRMSLPTFRRRKPAAADRTPEDETLRDVSCRSRLHGSK